MLILYTIFLLIGVPLAMLILHLLRPKFSIQGFLAILAVLAGWVLTFFARSDIPVQVVLQAWEPLSFFPNSPTLLIDGFSWYFSLALISLSMALIVTSIAKMGLVTRLEQDKTARKIEVIEDQSTSGERLSSRTDTVEAPAPSTGWPAWAGILFLTSFGVIAATAGNMLTLILAWAALDLIELTIMLGQTLQSKARERIILAFTARMAGIGIAFLAGIIPWSHGSTLTFDSISQSTSIYLIFAAGLRLGVLPLNLPVISDTPVHRELRSALRLVTAASSYVLLIRIANIGVLGPATPYLLVITALAGLYGALNWMNAPDELAGQTYWVVGTSSLAIASAIVNKPEACIAWSIASLMSGGLLSALSIRHRNLLPIIILGWINLSALPYTPGWMGASLFVYSDPTRSVVSAPLFYLVAFMFLLTFALLFAGFVRHSIRGVVLSELDNTQHVERWVWIFYPLGLIFITVTHSLYILFAHPVTSSTGLLEWSSGAIAVIIASGMYYSIWRKPRAVPRPEQPGKTSPLNEFFSLGWFYRNLWRLFRLAARLISLLSSVLEGEGGILWALVLFALIFVFLQR